MEKQLYWIKHKKTYNTLFDCVGYIKKYNDKDYAGISRFKGKVHLVEVQHYIKNNWSEPMQWYETENYEFIKISLKGLESIKILYGTNNE